MTANLQPYLPRLIRYWDQDAPGQLHRTIDGSMVFVDVSGFTKMSERLARHGNVGAEEVTEVIDNTFGQLLPEAYAFGANLLKFGGDALLLLFTDDTHALRAVAAAHAMRSKLRQIGVFSTTAGKVSLRMSVGIHTGAFDFFLVGASHRELIVAGPAATQTVMMESAAGPGQILLSPGTATAIPISCVGREVGPGYLLSGQPFEIRREEIQPASSGPSEMTAFIPAGLRETLVSGEVEPEHRPAAIAFIHYGEFDRLLAERGEDTAEALDQLVRTVQDSVDSRGVTFMATDVSGDGGKIILTAGVPGTTGNDEEQLLLALREIVNTAKSDFPLHIGLNWGHVFAGEVGPPYRRTYTIMGDAVNLAARLMAKAPAGEIYTTAGVLEGSRTTFNVSAPEPFYVKGKKLPIQAFSVGEPEGSRSVAEGAGLPLVGRDRELEVMVASWASAQNGNGRLVEVIAEPGMGKTRLLEEFLIKTNPDRLVRAECRLYQAATPYFPFRALLRGVWAMGDLDHDATARVLSDLVTTSAPYLEPWLALIGLPLGLDLPESPEVAQLEDQFRPARTIAAVGTLLEETVGSPTLLVIEDTHWMDEPSRELLAGLMIGLDRLPWLIALTRRPGAGGFVAPEATGVAKIELEPLSIEQAKELILSASEDSPLLPQHVEVLAQRAEGSPLFLVELLQALRRGGRVEELPHSVEGMIAARIDKLPPSDRNLLRRLSVLGNGFRLEHTAAVLRDHERNARWRGPALRRLTDFVATDQSGWIQFRHALIRDVAYNGLPFQTRQVLHAQIGDSICRAAGDKSDEQAELLSLHYFYAKHWFESWHFSRVAGDRAKAIWANVEAATFYERALASARRLGDVDRIERAGVLTKLAKVQYEAGSFVEALSTNRQAIKLVQSDLVASADLHLDLARVYQKLGAFAPALRETARGIALLNDHEDPAALKAKARLRAFRAGIRTDQFRHKEALKVGLLAIEEAQLSGELDALARAYSYIDEAYQTLGQRDKAIHEPMALEIFEQLGDLAGIALLTNNLGVQAYSDGRWDEAIELYSRAQDASRRTGNIAMEGVASSNLGEVLVSRGRLEAAEEVLLEARRVLRAQKYVRFSLVAETQLARLALERGDHVAAIQNLEEIVEEATSIGQTWPAIEAGIPLAAAHVRAGDPEAALKVVSQVQRLAGDEAGLVEVPLGRVQAEALAVMGRADEAREQADRALASARQQGLVFEQALLLLIKADLARIAGTEVEVEILEEANRLLKDLGASSYLARVPSTTV